MESRKRVAGRNGQACRRRRSRLEMTVGWDVWATLMQVAVVGGQQTVRVGQMRRMQVRTPPEFPKLGDRLGALRGDIYVSRRRWVLLSWWDRRAAAFF